MESRQGHSNSTAPAHPDEEPFVREARTMTARQASKEFAVGFGDLEELGSEAEAVWSNILVVDSDPERGALVRENLRAAGLRSDLSSHENRTLAMLEETPYEAVVAHADALGFEDLLPKIREHASMAPLLVLSANRDPNFAVEVLRCGASDHLVWPAQRGELVRRIEDLVKRSRQQRDMLRMLRSLEDAKEAGGLIGHSRAFRQAVAKAQDCVDAELPVLIEGEKGTGKRLLAKHLHDHSARSAGRLVERTALSVGLEELDLLCAARERSGTLLLAHAEELSAPVEEKLAAHLASGVPGPQILLLTSRDPIHELRAGRLGPALHSQLRDQHIRIPPLRERPEDIPLFAAAFLERSAAETKPKFVARDALVFMTALSWPRNIDELQTIIDRGILIADGAEEMTLNHVEGAMSSLGTFESSLQQSQLAHKVFLGLQGKDEIIPYAVEERRIIENALSITEGNISKAAASLRIGRATLYRKIKQLKIKVPGGPKKDAL